MPDPLLPNCRGPEALRMAHANAETSAVLLAQDLADWEARPVPQEPTAHRAHQNTVAGIKIALQRAEAKRDECARRLRAPQET